MLSQFILDLESVLTNPYSLLFFSLFGLGYYLKECSPFPNKLIPLALIVTGIGLAFLLLGISVTAALVGFVMSAIIMANYSVIKSTMQFYFAQKRANDNEEV